MKQLLFLLFFALLASSGFAQSNSCITMRVINDAGEGLVSWPVKVYQGGREVMTVYTDDEGEALAKPLDPNTYEVRVELNNVTRSIQNIDLGISETRSVTVDFRLEQRPYCYPVICLNCGMRINSSLLKQSGNFTLTAEQLEAMPGW